MQNTIKPRFPEFGKPPSTNEGLRIPKFDKYIREWMALILFEMDFGFFPGFFPGSLPP
jgi:hypothetical protein